MYEMAKKAREAMKSKARKMAGEKDQKVDSSDWSPSEPLNTEAKTGMRPISRRAFKKGGKVMGASTPVNLGRKARKSGGKVESEKAEAAEYAKAKTNRDVKAANEERPGVKHVGGMKKGGRTKREDGGPVDAETRRRIEAGYGKTPPDPVQMPKNPPMPPRRPADLDAKSAMSAEEAEAFMRNRKDGGKAKARKDGGKVATTLAGQKKIQTEQADASETHRGKASNYKKGGMAKKMDGGALMGGVLPALLMGGMGDDKDKKAPMKRGGRPGKFYGGGLGGNDMAMPPMAPGMQLPQMTPNMGGGAMGMPQLSPQMVQAAQQALGGMGGGVGGQPQMTGAAPLQQGMAMPRKSGGRAKGKTNVNIIISAGKAATPDMMQGPGGPLMPPPGVPVPLPGGPGGMPGGMPMGGAPGGMPPMPMPPPPMPGGMMGRKSGGRISKVAKSYKDMDAGSGSGLGRLQKTSIQSGKR